jgi:hypothetical protein
VTTDPEELDPELDVELAVDLDEDDDDGDDDGIPDGFVVESEGSVGADEGDDADDDVATVAVVIDEAAEVVEHDDFEEDVAPVVRVPDEEDDAPARRAGEFICTSCFLVKRDSQLAVRSRKVCRDCA